MHGKSQPKGRDSDRSQVGHLSLAWNLRLLTKSITSTAAENLDPNSSPVETRTMNFNQNDTPETEER